MYHVHFGLSMGLEKKHCTFQCDFRYNGRKYIRNERKSSIKIEKGGLL